MKLRESNIEKLEQGTFDALIVGGGINGAVAAASLSGKGAKVALIEQRDFRRLHQPAIEQSCLGRHQISGKPRLPLGARTVPEPQSPDRELSLARRGDPLLLGD